MADIRAVPLKVSTELCQISALLLKSEKRNLDLYVPQLRKAFGPTQVNFEPVPLRSKVPSKYSNADVSIVDNFSRLLKEIDDRLDGPEVLPRANALSPIVIKFCLNAQYEGGNVRCVCACVRVYLCVCVCVCVCVYGGGGGARKGGVNK